MAFLSPKFEKISVGACPQTSLVCSTVEGPTFLSSRYAPANSLISAPYPRLNCLKTIPFTAAHTYKPIYGSTPRVYLLLRKKESLSFLLLIAGDRVSTH